MSTLEHQIVAAARTIWNDLETAREDQPRRAELGGTSGPWVVYGAGGMGRRLAATLRASGRDVLGFMDAGKTGPIDGLPVWNPAEVPKSMLGASVALGLHNPMVDPVHVKSSLGAAGFSKVWMPHEWVEAYPELGQFWLAPISSLSELTEDIIRSCLECYGDSKSVGLIQAISSWRFMGESKAMGEPDMAGQYCPDDVEPMPRRLSLIDCGAYTGDTLLALSEKGFEIERYVGLEPDPVNYAKLVERVKNERGQCVCVPCGAWDKPQWLSFMPNDAAGSVREQGALEAGMISIQCLSIDQAFKSMAPNLIKMDIEGAEARALEGARETIEVHQPRLAVSSYHSPMDVWLLPNQIKSLMMQRGRGAPSMAIRSHARASFDSVIYAWRSAP